LDSLARLVKKGKQHTDKVYEQTGENRAETRSDALRTTSLKAPLSYALKKKNL